MYTPSWAGAVHSTSAVPAEELPSAIVFPRQVAREVEAEGLLAVGVAENGEWNLHLGRPAAFVYGGGGAPVGGNLDARAGGNVYREV